VTARRAGFALVASLIAVVLLGALIVGAFVSVTEEARIAGGIKSSERILVVAESAVEGDAAGWAILQADSLAAGGRVVRSTVIDGFQVSTTLVRLNSSMFWLIGDAAEGAIPGSNHRRIGLLLRRVVDSTGRGSLLRLEERGWSELF
jgi:type II secretory pathway pseudopilin PulG